jgi:O-antigen/teichoic acid export membrane protein
MTARQGAALRLSRLRGLATQGYGQSVFRRTGMLLTLLVPAYLANLAVMYAAAELLSAEQFGLFYVANTTGTTLFSGSLILNMFLTRHVAAVAAEAGAGAAFELMRQVERIIVSWGALAAAAIFAVMLFISQRLGAQSYLIVLFIVLDAFAAYATELGRVMLQSLNRTLSLGSYTLAWTSLRLVLCIAGILVFGTVWGALGGSLLAAAIVFAAFHAWVARNAVASAAAVPPLPPLLTLIPAVLGYGLSIVISNLDVLCAYLVLRQSDLGVYSASAIFPKAMLLLMTPLMQMLFPMLASPGRNRSDRLVVLGKTGAALLGLACAGVLFIWELSPLVCGGFWGLPLCDRPLLGTMLLSVVPMMLLRLLVLLGFARGRDWLPAWLAPPALAYFWIVQRSAPGMRALAGQFALFAAFICAFYFLVCIVATRARVFRAG